MQSPEPIHLPYTPLNNKLPQVFNNTTASYKYLWFWAILDLVKERQEYSIPLTEIAIEMVIKMWYPVHYFHLNFGMQDLFEQRVQQIKKITGLSENSKPDEIRKQLNQGEKETQKILKEMLRYVPYRFIQPWFEKELGGKRGGSIKKPTIKLARSTAGYDFNQPLYHFIGDKNEVLHIHFRWMDYLKDHNQILTDFTLWHFIQYLEKRNPNVSNLTAKLFRPLHRSLSKPIHLWKAYLQTRPDFRCIYTQTQPLQDFTLDHFLPWSFVAHDQLWNLIPTTRSVNSSKSNHLPKIDQFISPFIQSQFHFFHFMYTDYAQRDKKPGYKLFTQDYTDFFRSSLTDISHFPKTEFETRMTERLLPQFQVAQNMGFSPDWPFSPQ